MDTMSVKQASSRLNVAEKTIFRYLKKGKLTSEKIGAVHYIPATEVEKLALSRHVQKDEATHMRDRVDTLYELVGALDFRVRELEEKLRQMQTLPTVQTALPTVQTPQETHQEPRPIRQAQGNIPAGYVALSTFLHGLSASTVKRNIEMATGDWRDATGHVVNRALSPGQQSAFYQWACNRPGFIACEDCPHAPVI